MKYFPNFTRIAFALSLAFLTGCAVTFNKPTFDLPPKAQNEISVMSFNVENLFDTVHDEGKNDHTYLPLAVKKTSPEYIKACKENNDSDYRVSECLATDWSEEQLDKKLQNLSKVVLGVDGSGPDVLMLVEVENANVLNIWNNKYLKTAGYKTISILDGPDGRGINLGLISRLPLVGKPILHRIEWTPENDKDKEYMNKSRGIFEVTLKAPNGDPLTFFVVHFPSLSNPTYWRQQASDMLVKLIKAKGPDAMVVAAGDFNISVDEDRSNGFYTKVLSQAGAISHQVGCKKCLGTHNYRKKWSFLDAQIYSPALLAEGTGSYKLLPETIDVLRYEDVHIKRGKYPNRWDYDRKDGVSDHFPIYVRLLQRGPAKNPVKENTLKTETKVEAKTPKLKKTK